MKVYFLAGAEEDLKDLRRYLLHVFGEGAWRESYARIKEAIGLLQKTPKIGSIPEELIDLQFGHYRQVVSGKNRILYEFREEALYIHIICDVRRDMRALLARRLVRPSA